MFVYDVLCIRLVPVVAAPFTVYCNVTFEAATARNDEYRHSNSPILKLHFSYMRLYKI